MRLLRGLKVAGGRDGERRLAALARRLSAERATLEVVAEASNSETRAWRSAAREQASAVLALAQVIGVDPPGRGGQVGGGMVGVDSCASYVMANEVSRTWCHEAIGRASCLGELGSGSFLERLDLAMTQIF